MEGRSPDVPRCGIAQYRRKAFVNDIQVVVPDHKLHTTPFQGWAQVVPDEITLLLRGVRAALPITRVLGLVLHREAPEGQVPRCELLRKTNVMSSPGLAAVCSELPSTHHTTVLHPGGRTPRTREEVQRARRHASHRQADHGNDGPLVPLDTEGFQVEVTGCLATTPSTLTEVAGIHVQTAKPITQPIRRVVCPRNLLTHLHVHGQLRRRLCEGTSKPHECLVSLLRVQEHDGEMVRQQCRLLQLQRGCRLPETSSLRCLHNENLAGLRRQRAVDVRRFL
mmetsp:Transcript_42573/g.112343  ORF Transcript_42573/g.112343 Transcript_42573/m.112343 type:complete len:280 (+) Transcript_42573:668-1507(+)